MNMSLLSLIILSSLLLASCSSVSTDSGERVKVKVTAQSFKNNNY